MTQASQHLLRLARHVARPYQALPEARASMVTGSVADGLSDTFSDIDMAIYYDALPSEATLEQIRAVHGVTGRKWSLGSREDGGLIEAYDMAGVECQIIHSTLTHWEQQLNTALEGEDVASPLQKALSGMQKCVPLHGQAVIQGWKDRINDFPPALTEKMVNHYLTCFPVWAFTDNLDARDATIFWNQSVLEGAQNALGVLAGLNRVYYSSFQFKRMGYFVKQLQIAPPSLTERIKGLFQPDKNTVANNLKSIFEDVTALVETHMPQVDTGRMRRNLNRQIMPWSFGAIERVLDGS